MELKTYKQKVHKLMEDHKGARNNDGELIARYIARYTQRFITTDIDGDKCVKLKHFKNLPPFVSIIRARGIIQNDDQELGPTDEAVVRGRKQKEKSFREVEVREARYQYDPETNTMIETLS